MTALVSAAFKFGKAALRLAGAVGAVDVGNAVVVASARVGWFIIRKAGSERVLVANV